ncbi:MAG: hypothetical protein Q9164_007365, partial [Protoblastenia rupestris]
MFSSVGLFKQIECPEEAHCILPNCIFAHTCFSQKPVANKELADPAASNHSSDENQASSVGPRKRRRLDSHDRSHHPRDLEPSAGKPLPAAAALPVTALRSISPPPLRRSKKHKERPDSRHSIKTTNAAEPNGVSQPTAVTLNPRMLPNPPATHAVRMQLIKMLYDHMSRLNEEIKQGHDPSKAVLELSKEELILAALGEEETVAKDNPAVYANIIKLRIVKLKKMRVAEWKQERSKQIIKQAPITAPIEPKTLPKIINTGLKPNQETAILPRLLAKQNGLAKHGYVPKAPSTEEVDQARQGVEAAHGWEQCDRCKTRFQVFPGRKEDGALTSGGHCTYHPTKPRRPMPNDKADKVSKEPIFACCNENVGTSSGCTSASSHVFKVLDPKRLALIMPFENTPANTLITSENTAVCFDCEMGYTTVGLELIRLTATSWPSEDELIDVLVRPLGEILDFNSRFSGVWPKDFANASPYNNNAINISATSEDGELASPILPIVDSPMAARALLFSHLSPSTPLIGHALDNDLNASRIIHPSIIDT